MKIAICSPISLSRFKDILPISEFQEVSIAVPSIEEQIRFFSQDQTNEIHVITENSNFKNDVFNYKNLTFHLIKAPSHLKLPTFYYFDSLHISYKLQEIKPDIIEAHWAYEYSLGALKSKIPCILKIHDWMPHEIIIEKRIEFLIKWGILEYVLRKGKFFSCPSPYIANLISTKIKKPIFVLPPMVFPEYYYINNKDYIYDIFIPSGILKRKNSLTILKVLSKLLKKNPALKVVIGGPQFKSNSNYYKQCYNLLDQLMRNKSIINAGFLNYSQLYYYYSKSAIVLHAATEETFGMVTAEGMAAGRTVISSINGGSEFQISNSIDGFLVEPFDVNSYVLCIENVLSNNELRILIGNTARKKMQGLLNPKEIFKNSIDIYKKVIELW